MPGGIEWIIIGLAIILLFGAKKLPELARALGKSLTEFRKSQKEISSEESKKDSED